MSREDYWLAKPCLCDLAKAAHPNAICGRCVMAGLKKITKKVEFLYFNNGRIDLLHRVGSNPKAKSKAPKSGQYFHSIEDRIAYENKSYIEAQFGSFAERYRRDK